MNKKQPIQYTLSAPNKIGPIPLIEFEWDFSYEDVVTQLSNTQQMGDLDEFKKNKQRIDAALKNDSLSILPFCVFRIKSPEDGDLSEYVYFIYDDCGSAIAARLVYDSKNNFYFGGIHCGSDFYDENSIFHMDCYLILNNDGVHLFNFYGYYINLCYKGDYKGSFAEFLECDEILDYINYFKMIEY